MDIHINMDETSQIDNITFKKMVFFYNALNDGWSIKKIKGDKYIFSKSHEGKKEVFLDSYLTNFIKSNVGIDKLISSQIEK